MRKKGILMDFDKKDYKKYADAHAPRTPCFINCLFAFAVGGWICALGEVLLMVYTKYLELAKDDAGLLLSVTLIFVAVVLTGFGVFDCIARYAGAGTLVPITGFANSVASSALDSRSEGYVLGVGAKIFTVAGPVLLYGTAAGVIWGLIYWMFG